MCVSAGTWSLLCQQDRSAGSDQGSGPRAGSEQHQGQLRGPRSHQDALQRGGERQHPCQAKAVPPTSHLLFLSEQLWENEAIMEEFKKQLSIKRCWFRFLGHPVVTATLVVNTFRWFSRPSGSDRWRKSAAWWPSCVRRRPPTSRGRPSRRAEGWAADSEAPPRVHSGALSDAPRF